MKIIDKILYYFGYAPITISQEVKFYAVGKPLETVICRSVLQLGSRESNSLYPSQYLKEQTKRKIKSMLIEEIDKAGLINYTRTNDPFYSEYNVSAELRIVKN